VAIGRAPEVRIDRLRVSAVTSTVPNHAVVFFWDTAPTESARTLLAAYREGRRGGRLAGVASQRGFADRADARW
jgi:hypothetical protein